MRPKGDFVRLANGWSQTSGLSSALFWLGGQVSAHKEQKVTARVDRAFKEEDGNMKNTGKRIFAAAVAFVVVNAAVVVALAGQAASTR